MNMATGSVATTSAPGEGDAPIRTDVAGPLALSRYLLIGLFVVFGGWAVLTPIKGAVIGSGAAVVEGRALPIQSLDGGIVAEIFVAEGDRVAAGQPLLRLDETLMRIGLNAARGRLASLSATAARLTAEQTGLDRLVFDYAGLPVDPAEAALYEIIETRIFELRRAQLDGRGADLGESVAQIESQMRGIEAQIAAAQAQYDLAVQGQGRLDELFARRLVNRTQVDKGRASVLGLRGQIDRDSAELRRLGKAMSQARIQADQTGMSLDEDTARELQAIRAEMTQLVLEIATQQARLDRVEIRAPGDGVVHELIVGTTGAVVPPRETILEIVPSQARIEFEVRVPPMGIDDIAVDQTAEIMISAFKLDDKLFGTVKRISPDVLEDARTGERHYEVTVVLSADQVAVLGDRELIPGMPADVFFQTRSRSAAQYLVGPLIDPLMRAFRE